MKVFGYVNCYNRGINMVQGELETNGNGNAEFSSRLITAFEANVSKTSREEDSDQATRDMKREDKLLLVLKDNQAISLPKMAEAIGLSVAGMRKVLDKLRAAGRVQRIGHDKGGRWEVVKLAYFCEVRSFI